jgi:16S rRNA U516 pseudouridylate synthase RsuA-like enzyme
LRSRSAGRADGLATGLVVFTQDGRMRRRLLEDEAELEQEFMVELPGQHHQRRSNACRAGCNRHASGRRCRWWAS